MPLKGYGTGDRYGSTSLQDQYEIEIPVLPIRTDPESVLHSTKHREGRLSTELRSATQAGRENSLKAVSALTLFRTREGVCGIVILNSCKLLHE